MKKGARTAAVLVFLRAIGDGNRDLPDVVTDAPFAVALGVVKRRCSLIQSEHSIHVSREPPLLE